jgi:uncharacterized protein
MEFDRYTIALLILRNDAPVLSDEQDAALQDAHMAHLADLYEAGHLLISGPVLGSSNRELRGLSILNVDPDEALRLKNDDPAVRAGRYRVEAYPWVMPKGLFSFSRGQLPRSMAEAFGNPSSDGEPA